MTDVFDDQRSEHLHTQTSVEEEDEVDSKPWVLPFGVSRFLPLEIALLVFSFLDVVSLARCMRVCIQWRRVLVTEKSLWVEQFGEFGITHSQVERVIQSCSNSVQRAVRSILRPVGALATNQMFGPEQVICIPAALEPVIFPVKDMYRLRPVHLGSDSVLLLSEMMYSGPTARVVYQSCIPVGIAKLQRDPRKALEITLAKNVLDWDVRNPRVFAHCPWGNSLVLSDVAQMVSPKSPSHAVPDTVRKLVWLSCEGERIGESEQLNIFSDDLKIAICSNCGTVVACREMQTEEEDGRIRQLSRFVFHPSKKIWTETEQIWELPSDLQLKGLLKAVFIRGEGKCGSPGEGGVPCQSHKVILCSKHEESAIDIQFTLTHYMDICVCDFVTTPEQTDALVENYRMTQVSGEFRIFQPTFVPDERSVCVPYVNTMSKAAQLYPHFLVHLPSKESPNFTIENATFQTSVRIGLRRDRMSNYTVFAHGTLFSLKARMMTTYTDATQAEPPVTDFEGSFVVMPANGSPAFEPLLFSSPSNLEGPSHVCTMSHLHRFMVNGAFLSPIMADHTSSDSIIDGIIIPISCKLSQ